MANRTYLKEPLSASFPPALTNERTERHGFLAEQDAESNVAKLADLKPNHRWEVERSEPTGGPQFSVSGYPY